MKNDRLKRFYKEYKEYLLETEHTSNTADQYCTYLKKACVLLNLGEGFIEAVIAISDSNVQASLCEYLMAKLSNERELSKNKDIKKKISKYRSAVSALSEFVTKDDIVKSVEETFSPTVTLPYESVYDQKELFKKFKSRLGTQERYYYEDNASFSARVVNRIAAKNKRRNLYKKIILDTKFLYGADVNSFFRLKDITKLTIKTDGTVKIEVKDNEYDVYTQVYKEGKFVGFEILRINSLEYASLDHVHSVHELYPDFLKTHGELCKFSDNMIKHRRACSDMRDNKFATHYYNDIYPNILTHDKVSIDEKLMLDEANEFIDKLELLVIHRSYNSSKSDK